MLEASQPRPAIRLDHISFRYGGVLALSDLSLTLMEGEFAALLGANGAGKSTLAKLMAGMLRPRTGTITLGASTRIDRPPERSLIDMGVALVPERRRLFGQLSIQENLSLAAHGVGCNRSETARRLDDVMRLLPEKVRDGRHRAAATFSGGEQQMVAIGRAIMAEPRIMIIDEPSLGLAPIMIDRVYELLDELNAKGVTVLTVEQIATHALRHARRLFVMEHGTITHSGLISDAVTLEAARVSYLGHAD